MRLQRPRSLQEEGDELVGEPACSRGKHRLTTQSRLSAGILQVHEEGEDRVPGAWGKLGC